MLDFISVNNSFAIEGFYSAIRFNWDDNFVFNGESHNFWEAVFVVSGEAEVTEDEKVYILREGNLVFHAPMEFHRIKSSGGSSPQVLVFTFQATGRLPESLDAGVFTLDPKQIKYYTELFDTIYDFVHNNFSDSLVGMKAEALLMLFIIKMASKSANNRVSTAQSAVEYRRIVSFMTDNVCENLTLDDIARKNNISVSYIKFLFSSYAGISPKNYFNQLRIQRATELLNKGFGVTEVADIMNFSSPNYFSAFFKRYTGSLPSQLM